MSEQPAGPVAGDPGSAEQTAEVEAQLRGQATVVQGQDSAGIYGDVAGASQRSAPQSDQEVAEELQAKGAKATEVDVAALMEQMQKMQADLAALQSAAPATPAEYLARPPVLEEVHSSLSGHAPGIVHAFELIAARLTAIEEHLFGKPEEDTEPEA